MVAKNYKEAMISETSPKANSSESNLHYHHWLFPEHLVSLRKLLDNMTQWKQGKIKLQFWSQLCNRISAGLNGLTWKSGITTLAFQDCGEKCL